MSHKRVALLLAAACTFAGNAYAQSGDSLRLSLDDALARAVARGEEVALARSQVDIAGTQIKDARSGAMPQVSGVFGYTRTFESQFSSSTSFTLPDSLKFEPDSLGSVQQRLKYLEDKAPLAGLGGLSSLFSNLPFGRENAYALQLSGSQLLYSGGRTGAALSIARAYRETASLQLKEQLADIDLAVRTAYFRALLAHEMQRIAQAALEQSQKFLAEEELRAKTGAASELDVLRAQVAAANLEPQLIQARTASDVATLDLKRLVNVPAGQPLALTTTLDPPGEELMRPVTAANDWYSQRAAFIAAQQMVKMRELAVKIARGSFLPSLALQMNYSRYAYPGDPFKLGGVQWQSDWTAGLGVQIPIFDGLKRNAALDNAHAQLNTATLQLSQLQEAIQLQFQLASGDRARAASTIRAREITVTQAQRVYDLTVMRYEKGLATQLEVSDARLGLLQARTNLAQAVSDFYIADATLKRTLGSR